MKKGLSILKSTATGGVLFLVPFIVIIIVLGKGIEIARRVSRPVVRTIGVETFAGIALGTAISILALVLLALVAGIFARTRLGQRVLASMENSVLSALPQFKVAHGFIQSLDPQAKAETQVVLVPTDAGWQVGIAFDQPDGDWWSVFLPSAPQWSSGVIVYAHKDDVHQTGFNLTQAMILMRECGAGSAKIRSILARLREQGEI
jgi:uncharacterized membrane protein